MSVSVSRTFRALRHRNFRLFFTGQGLSLMGTWLQQVAMGWLTYRLTHSAWLLGVVAFCANVGILLFSNVAGVLADRIDRRRGLLTTQSLMLSGGRARRSGRLRLDRDLAPDRAGAVARDVLGVRSSAAPVDVRALHCRSR